MKLFTLLLLCASISYAASTSTQQLPGFDDAVTQEPKDGKTSPVSQLPSEPSSQTPSMDPAAENPTMDPNNPQVPDALTDVPPKGTGATSVNSNTNFADNCARAQAYKQTRFNRWAKECYNPSTGELNRLDQQYAAQCGLSSSNVYSNYSRPSTCESSGTSSGSTSGGSLPQGGQQAAPQNTAK